MKTNHTSFITIACCTLLALFACKRNQQQNVTNTQPGAAERPEMVTSGIGAKFTVPAGQVATFEIVTRRDNATVPIPPLAAYVLAPVGEPISGTFRWFPESDQTGPDIRRHVWKIEVISGAGNGSVSGLSLPDALEPAVGRLIVQPQLEPNAERIHWLRNDDGQLPADGLVGLRIITVAHDLKTGGSGVAHADWKKTQTKTQP